MKKVFILPFLLILFAMSPAKKTKIIFFGDSITEAGAKKGGFIDIVQNKINSAGLQEQYELVGAGIGGNKVYDLYLRMEEDVMAKNPDIVVIYIGINDVWHKTTHGTGTDKDKYEKFYTAIIKKLQAQKIRVIVCTPTVIGELKGNVNQQDTDLNEYSDVIRRLGAAFGCTVVDLRNTFFNYEAKYNTENKPSGILTTDRVHLNTAGNELVATEMIKALGL